MSYLRRPWPISENDILKVCLFIQTLIQSKCKFKQITENSSFRHPHFLSPFRNFAVEHQTANKMQMQSILI